MFLRAIEETFALQLCPTFNPWMPKKAKNDKSATATQRWSAHGDMALSTLSLV